MSAWWLLLIVPASLLLGFLIGVFPIFMLWVESVIPPENEYESHSTTTSHEDV